VIADPHCHTLASDGMVTPAELIDAAAAANLNLIAVTDHDTMASVKEAQARGEARGIAVVAGQEVTTAGPWRAHILGWFLERPVRRGLSVEDTVDAIHAQGGLAVVPHPFMPFYFGSIQPAALMRLLERHRIDGIETMSTVPMGGGRRRLLAEFCTQHVHGIGAQVGASDCHFGEHDIGQVVTRYEGDFRAAIEQRTTVPVRLRKANVPTQVALRQQWRSLVELPWRRLRGQL
jgi:hypothetical protein